jgi:hypothetical protein
MTLSVTVNSVSANGTKFTITIAKQGSDTAAISILQDGDSHKDTYDVYDVRADATTLKCTATVLFFHPNVTCEVGDSRPPGAATVTVTIANAPAYNGSTDYQISAADSANIKQFLATAAFPPLAGIA